jgi:hypothetical protein
MLLIADLFLGKVAIATPVLLEYTGTVSGTPTVPGVAPGALITFRVLADNGGQDLESQTWDWTDVLSATMNAGSYEAITAGATFGGFGGFATNPLGHLSLLDFGLGQGGSATDGNTSFGYFMDGANYIWFTNATATSFNALSPPTIANTSITLVAATPLPSSLPLLATALTAGVIAGWRRKKEHLTDRSRSAG